jgi:hypothetical protein
MTRTELRIRDDGTDLDISSQHIGYVFLEKKVYAFPLSGPSTGRPFCFQIALYPFSFYQLSFFPLSKTDFSSCFPGRLSAILCLDTISPSRAAFAVLKSHSTCLFE